VKKLNGRGEQGEGLERALLAPARQCPAYTSSMSAGTDPAGIVSERLRKRFGALLVLQSVSFMAPRGKVTLLAGRNGAGKTTWLRAALGLARADEGWVRFGSLDVSHARPMVAVVPDEPSVYGRFSGHRNLRLLSGVRRPARLRLAQVQELLGLDDPLLRRRANRYSLGQRRRLATAAALLRQPRYLFLDEPTVGLDPLSWRAVSDALLDLAHSGSTVLLTGQDFSGIQGLCHHIAVLHGGLIVFEGPIESFLRRRAPRVRVVLQDLQELASGLDRPVEIVDSGTLDVPCADERDADAVLEQVRSLGLPFRSLAVTHDNLSEAFIALHHECEEARRADEV
jgi:ABC-type multidrug transport system ATPase subunit